MKNFFKWLLVAYLITVPLIIFGSYISPLSAVVIWIAYIPACGIGLYLLNKIYKVMGLPVPIRASMHVLMAIGLFVYPTWDGFVGKYYLNKMCDLDGGVYVRPGVKINSLYVSYIKANIYPVISGNESLDSLAASYKRTFDRYKERTDLSVFEIPAKDVSGKYIKFYYDDSEIFRAEISEKISSQYEELSTGSLDSFNEMYGAIFPKIYLGNLDFFYRDRVTKERVFGFKNYKFIYSYDRYLSPIGSAPSVDCHAIRKDDEKFNLLKVHDFLQNKGSP
ncbi:MAG TPA: hypothetical protein VIM96_02040 [Pseudomonadales bacterium]